MEEHNPGIYSLSSWN